MRCLVNFLKKVDHLCPDFGRIDIEITCMSGWKCSYSFVMSEGPVCFLGHFKCLVLVEMLVECLVSQVSFAFSDVLFGMHHNYARAFISLSYGEVLILPELVQGYLFLLGDIGVKGSRLDDFQLVLHLSYPLIDHLWWFGS